MITLLSPAKSLNMDVEYPDLSYSQPQFLDDSEILVNQMRTFEPHQLSDLMSISAKLGELNAERFQSWVRPFSTNRTRPAILAFQGDVYQGMDAESMSEDDLQFANRHIRLLSGLYGVLRPLDLMHAYRLEMGTKLENDRGKNLYAFWGDKVSESLNDDLASLGAQSVVNLASNEYFKVIKSSLLNGRVITPVFKDWKNDQFKVISFLAKKARGMMARYMVDNRIEDPEGLKQFTEGGYVYDASGSTESQWLFTRRSS